jgi:hypothetical protein
VDVYVPAAEGQAGSRYATDFITALSASHTWDLLVDTDIPNAEVMVSFPDLSELPRGYRAFLVDRDAGIRQSLRTRASYTYNSGPGAGERRLAVEVTTDSAALLTVTGVSAVPTRGGGVDIAFDLSQPARVQVAIVNAAGRLLRAIGADGVLPRGRGMVLWNGRSAQETLAPAGVYVVRVRAIGDDGQQASGVTALALTR